MPDSAIITAAESALGRRLAARLGPGTVGVATGAAPAWPELVAAAERLGPLGALVLQATEPLEGDGDPETIALDTFRSLRRGAIEEARAAVRAVLPSLRLRPEATVLFVVTTQGEAASPGATVGGAVASGLIQMAQTLALSEARQGGPVRVMTLMLPDPARLALAPNGPPDPDHLAEIAQFLLSPAARPFNGAVLRADGGLSMVDWQ